MCCWHLQRQQSKLPRTLAALLGRSSFKDELFSNNLSTVSDTNRLFFNTRRARLLAPAIFFLNKHMYCSQCKENPTHYLCLSSLCPINNIPVCSWPYSVLIQIQHCFPGFPFGGLSATKQLVLFRDLPSQRLYFLGTETVSCPFSQFWLSREHFLL